MNRAILILRDCSYRVREPEINKWTARSFDLEQAVMSHFCRVNTRLISEIRDCQGFYGLGKTTMDAMRFILNCDPISQAGRRGSDSRLPI